MKSLIALAATVLFAAACSRGSESSADSANGAIDTSADSAMPPFVPTQPPILSDDNIAALVASADSAEIALGRLVQTKGTNAGVRSYAHLLVTEHSAHAKVLASIQAKAGITAQPMPGDTSALMHQHTLERFQSMTKGTDFDTAFVNLAVAAHQKVLSDVQAAELQTQQPDLKALLTKTIPVLQKHLDRAQALQKQLGGGT